MERKWNYKSGKLWQLLFWSVFGHMALLIRWVAYMPLFAERKEEPPSCSPNQDFMTGFVVQVCIIHGRHRVPLHVMWGCCYSASVKCTVNAFLPNLHLPLSPLQDVTMNVCASQGHSRSGKVQDHYDSLLQRSHGEHRTAPEQADWIIRLTSLPLCSRSAPLTDSPLCVRASSWCTTSQTTSHTKTFRTGWRASKKWGLLPRSHGKDNQERLRNSAQSVGSILVTSLGLYSMRQQSHFILLQSASLTC